MKTSITPDARRLPNRPWPESSSSISASRGVDAQLAETAAGETPDGAAKPSEGEPFADSSERGPVTGTCGMPSAADAAETDGAQPAVWAAVLRRLETQWQLAQAQWMQRWERHGVQLACRIAALCLRDSLVQVQSSEVAERLMREALQSVPGAVSCRVRLSPEDHRHWESTAADYGGHVDLVADPAVGRGECVVEADDAHIDLTFASQLERIEQELTG